MSDRKARLKRLQLKARQAAAQGETPTPQKNPDGTYGTPPEGTVTDSRTGQMVDPTLMRNRVTVGKSQAAKHGVGQGLGLGLMDETVAGMYGALGPGEFGEDYDYALAHQRAELDANREEHPVITTGGEVVGGVASALTGLGAVKQAATAPAQVMRAMVAGGLSGGAFGFNAGEGGLKERSKSGAMGGIIGGATGGAAVPVGRAIAAATRRAAPVLQTLLGNKFRSPAHNATATALDRSGKTGTEVADAVRSAAREGQDSFTVADAIGRPGQKMLSGVARSTPDAATDIQERLVQRQTDQSGRVSSFLADAFDAHAPASQQKVAAKAVRKAAANENYAAARQNAAPVDVRRAIGAIDDRIGGMQGSGVKGDGIDARLGRFRARLTAKNPAQSEIADGSASSIELSDFDRVLGVKQDLQDEIGAAVRAGRNNEARELTKLSRALDQALEESSDGYRTANNAYARQSKAIDQFDVGARAASPRVRPEETVSQYRKLAPKGGDTALAADLDPRSAFRAGYADPVIAKVENSAAGSNTARPLTSQKFKKEAGAMATDPDLLARRLGRENTMFETNQTVLGGSRTADNLIDMEDVGRFDNGVLSALMRGRVLEAAGHAAGKVAGPVLNRVQGRGPNTRNEIAKMLMQTGDEGADLVRQLLANNALDAKTRARLIDQLTALSPAATMAQQQ